MYVPIPHCGIARLQTTAHVRKYLKERVKVEFDGIDQSEGMIAQATDKATGLIDEAATIGNILTIHGYGLKIESDEEHTEQAGVFFVPTPGVPIKAKVIAVNENRTLKVLVPAELVEGKAYQFRGRNVELGETYGSTAEKGPGHTVGVHGYGSKIDRDHEQA